MHTSEPRRLFSPTVRSAMCHDRPVHPPSAALTRTGPPNPAPASRSTSRSVQQMASNLPRSTSDPCSTSRTFLLLPLSPLLAHPPPPRAQRSAAVPRPAEGPRRHHPRPGRPGLDSCGRRARLDIRRHRPPRPPTPPRIPPSPAPPSHHSLPFPRPPPRSPGQAPPSASVSPAWACAAGRNRTRTAAPPRPLPSPAPQPRQRARVPCCGRRHPLLYRPVRLLRRRPKVTFPLFYLDAKPSPSSIMQPVLLQLFACRFSSILEFVTD